MVDVGAVLDALGEFPEVRLLYLFGSRVEGRTGPLSDFDFGALFAPHVDDAFARKERLASALRRALGEVRVDVVALSEAPVELAYAVIAQGTLLYERGPAARVEYEAYVMGRYGDYLPVLRAQRRDILRGGGDDARVQRYRAALGRTQRTLGALRAAE
jgi:predicted nucleotidyltransferase